MAELGQIDLCLEDLKDPFDEIDFETKKHLSLWFYFSQLKANKGFDKQGAASYAGAIVNVHPKTVKIWAMAYTETRDLGVVRD